MSIAELDSWAIEIQFSTGVWSDVTADVIVADVVRCEKGIMDNGPTDRVARTGRLQFSLDNSTNNSAGLAGYYSPGHTNCRTGFDTGIPVRITFTYDSLTRTKFYGRIAKDGIQPEPGIYGTRRTKVTALDWMNQAATHEIQLPAYTTNKRIDEVVPLVVAPMPLQPLATSYGTGADTFTSVFDTVRDKTTAMSEFQKLAMSEWGFIYVTQNQFYDEVLTVEGRGARSTAGTAYTQVPISSDMSGFLLLENGSFLLQENGDRLILDESQASNFYVDMGVNPEISYGKHLANYITVTSYPRKFDTAATILYSLPSAISLAAGETRNLTANFRDPQSLANRVAGKDMISPAATTDYLMNASSAGTAADLTANLTVSHTYGANAGSYALTNAGTVDGYVTKLEARGLGIYLYDPVEYIAQDSSSQSEHGLQTLDINMPYQDDVITANLIGQFLSSDLRDPRYEVDKYPFWATRDENLLMSFLFLEIGARIRITETQTGFERDRYIDGIAFEVHPNKQVKCTWMTRFISSATTWQLGVTDHGELGVNTILG